MVVGSLLTAPDAFKAHCRVSLDEKGDAKWSGSEITWVLRAEMIVRWQWYYEEKCIRVGIGADFMECKMTSPGGWGIKNPLANAGDTGDVSSIPGWGRSPGGSYGNPLQCSCLENLMDRGAWRASVHGVAMSQTWLSDWACIASERGLKRGKLGD